MTMYAFIHIEKTAGWSIRHAIQNSVSVRYMPHAPITTNIAREFTTLAVLRDPVDRFISWFKWIHRHHGLLDDVQSLLEQNLLFCLDRFRRCSDYYFLEHDPDIILHFDNIQTDWRHFIESYNIVDADTHLTRKHVSLEMDFYLTKTQLKIIQQALSDDINNYYGEVRVDNIKKNYNKWLQRS